MYLLQFLISAPVLFFRSILCSSATWWKDNLPAARWQQEGRLCWFSPVLSSVSGFQWPCQRRRGWTLWEQKVIWLVYSKIKLVLPLITSVIAVWLYYQIEIKAVKHFCVLLKSESMFVILISDHVTVLGMLIMKLNHFSQRSSSVSIAPFKSYI